VYFLRCISPQQRGHFFTGHSNRQMVLFGMVAAGLGLQVESVQGKFPDCIARRQVAPGKWQYLRIEFEYESRNFKLHGHDPKGCDMIVCWRHNWKECPVEIEVVELSKLIGWR